MISDQFLSLLVCPMGKAPLKREGDDLTCTHCGTKFAIKDDIPNMIIEEADAPPGLCGPGRPRLRQGRPGEGRGRLSLDLSRRSGRPIGLSTKVARI